MQYMLLIYEDEQIYGPNKDGPAMQQIVAKHMAFGKEIGSARVGGAGLKGTAAATTVRTAGGAKTIHDGPFAETKEQLGGYYLIDVPDLDAAIAIAKKLPVLQDGAVEIRPLLGGA
ncbi:MAG TPA: YciI family protein [Candidatus Binataceae bacterium]|nr:YciI family protein [Candidatus Binataceae bacterium]